jgi:UDP-2-acetamido-2-deoxy-ribo-hexuluronate aminotransferase
VTRSEGRIALADLRALDRAHGTLLRAAVDRVAASGRFVLGEEVSAFERALAARLGAAHAVGVGSGSDALYLALRAAGVQPGDVVITTPLSFIATAEAIVRAGARPQFVDVDDSLCLSATAVTEYLERCRRSDGALRDPRGAPVRALLPVHLYGRLADVAALEAVARDAGLALIHDAAHAFGARLEGHTACLSFFPGKTLGAWGDGGAVVTNDDEVARALRSLREHGRTAEHRYETLGLNSRLDAIHAAVLAAKLPLFDAEEAKRREHAAYYDARLGEYVGTRSLREGEVCSLYTVRVGNRDALRAHLDAQGIDTAVYYPTLLCDQAAIDLEDRPDVPRARLASSEVLTLPCHAFMDRQALDRVVDAIISHRIRRG